MRKTQANQLVIKKTFKNQLNAQRYKNKCGQRVGRKNVKDYVFVNENSKKFATGLT